MELNYQLYQRYRIRLLYTKYLKHVLEINGFNKKTFECWYSLSKITQPVSNVKSPTPNTTQSEIKAVKNNVEYALSIIDPEEYEFINTIDDIIFSDELVLSDVEKQQVLNEIMIRKEVKGGKKRSNFKRTKNKKKKKKKRKKNKTLKKQYFKYKK